MKSFTAHCSLWTCYLTRCIHKTCGMPFWKMIYLFSCSPFCIRLIILLLYIRKQGGTSSFNGSLRDLEGRQKRLIALSLREVFFFKLSDLFLISLILEVKPYPHGAGSEHGRRQVARQNLHGWVCSQHSSCALCGSHAARPPVRSRLKGLCVRL